MQILEILDWGIHYNEDSPILNVRAIVEDCVILRQQAWEGPEEYGPGICKTEISLYDTKIPDNENEIMNFLENYQPDWILEQSEWIQGEI